LNEIVCNLKRRWRTIFPSAHNFDPTRHNSSASDCDTTDLWLSHQARQNEGVTCDMFMSFVSDYRLKPTGRHLHSAALLYRTTSRPHQWSR